MGTGTVLELVLYGNWYCIGTGTVWELVLYWNWYCMGTGTVWELVLYGNYSRVFSNPTTHSDMCLSNPKMLE